MARQMDSKRGSSLLECEHQIVPELGVWDQSPRGNLHEVSAGTDVNETGGSMKRVPLTKGMTALVDDEDYDRVMEHSWCASKTEKTWYAQATINSRHVSMHRFILSAIRGQYVDHVNHDGLDNRRSNIRVCCQSRNAGNAVLHCKNKTGLKGVFFHPERKKNKWTARICQQYKQKALGAFDTPEAAARAYDSAALERFGEFALTNAKLGLLPHPPTPAQNG